MAVELKGKIVLITGASSGIGRATALMLGRMGCRLALVGRSAERLEAVKARLEGVEIELLPADLGEAGETDRVATEAMLRFGHLDIVLANAGLYVPGEVAEGDPDQWDELIRVNVSSVFRLVRAVLPQMVERRQGDIIVTSSISGHQAIHWEPVYSASKHAVQAFVHGLRRQLAEQGVRVGAIAPGMVANELWGFNDDAVIGAKVGAGEALHSDDIAEAIVFMLTRPRHVAIRDLVILPQRQAL